MSSKVLRSNGVVLKNAGVSFCYNKNGRSKISSGFKYIQLNNTGPIFKTYSATAGSFFKEDCARSLGGEGDHAPTLFTVTSLPGGFCGGKGGTLGVAWPSKLAGT